MQPMEKGEKSITKEYITKRAGAKMMRLNCCSICIQFTLYHLYYTKQGEISRKTDFCFQQHTFYVLKKVLLNLSFEFYHCRNFFMENLTFFPITCIENNHERSHVSNFSRIIFKRGKDIYCSMILDEYDYGGFVSLNMPMINHLMIRSISAFLCLFFKLKPSNLVQM